jgi:hypothetical protein
MNMSMAQLFSAIAGFPPLYLLIVLILAVCVAVALCTWIYIEIVLARDAWLNYRARAVMRNQWIANSTQPSARSQRAEPVARRRRGAAGAAEHTPHGAARSLRAVRRERA